MSVKTAKQGTATPASNCAVLTIRKSLQKGISKAVWIDTGSLQRDHKEETIVSLQEKGKEIKIVLLYKYN